MFARFRDESASIGSESALTGVTHSAENKILFGDQNSCYRYRLSDGRVLSWAEFGHSHGYPILYMHRQGGCRLEAQFLHDAALEAGFRLIAVDRPGLGGSDFFAFDDPAVLVDDYVQLLNHLRLPQVAVFSWGGGSHFAVEMASRFPERVAFLNLLSPQEYSCSLVKHRLLALPAKMALRTLLAFRAWRADGDDTLYLQRWREQMCYADRIQIDDPAVESVLAGIAHESMKQGTAGVAQDIWLGLTAVKRSYTSLGESGLHMPVHIWSGAADSVGRADVFNPGATRGCDEREQKGVFRHWVRRHGYLFFRHIAGDIFRIARQEARANLVAGGPAHR